MRSMAMGVQNTPSPAIAAYAAAMVSGAISFVPRTEDGLDCSAVPSARCTPMDAAVSRISHRSSRRAIDTNAPFTDNWVARPTLISPLVASSFLNVNGPRQGPPQESVKRSDATVRGDPFTSSFRPWPRLSQSRRVKIL
jgi:hypothetical protein